MLYKIILIYLAFVLLIFSNYNIKNNKLEKFIFSICVPVFGLLIVIISENIKSIDETQNRITNSNQKLKKNRTNFAEAEIQSSLIDSLLLEDYNQAREILLSVKYFDFKEQCAVYKIAIKSKNVEIAHIAAVSLMEIKNFFEKSFRSIEEENNDQPQVLKKHIELLNQYLECNLVTGALQKKYSKDLINQIEKLKQIEPSNTQYIKILINKYVELEEYEKALDCFEKFEKQNELNPEIYEELLKLYMKKNDFKNFTKALGDMRVGVENSKKIEHFIEFWENV